MLAYRKNHFLIILSILLVITGCGIQVKSARKKSIAEEAKKEAQKGDVLWKGSWWGKGGPSKVFAGPGERILIADGHDVEMEIDDLKDPTVIFRNSIGSSRDSLLLHFIHNNVQDEKGEWGWVSFCIAGGNPWEWAPQNISKCNAIMMDVKGEPGGETMSFKMEDISGNSSDDVNVNLYLPKGKITTEWQRVIIPFVVMGEGMNKMDLTGWKSMCGAVGPEGEHKVYVDNVIFFEVSPEDLPPEIKPMLELKIMAANPDKYLDKVITFDWDKSTDGWISSTDEGIDETVKELKQVPIEKTKIAAKDREGHGKGVLQVDATLSPTDFAKIAVTVKKGTDWSKIKFVQYDVYMPSDGIKTLSAVPFVQSDNWAKWAQADSSAVVLKPGEWVTVQFTIPNMANLQAENVDGYGTFLWGRVEKEYKGPIYLDNWRVYGSKAVKENKLELLSRDEYKKAKQVFTPLDLTKAANMGFEDKINADGKGGWTDQGGNDMREFKFTGETKFLNIPFKIIDPKKNNGKSCIVLRGQNNKAFPIKAEISVNKKAAGIYFLHSAAWSSEVVGRYKIIYKDDTECVLKLRDGEEVFNWWGSGESETARSIWEGVNKETDKISLYLCAWANPKPDVAIKKIVAETDGDKAFLMLVAATLTGDGPYLPKIKGEELDTSNWFAYEKVDENKAKGSILDASFLLDAPAGKHGHIKTKGDKFVFGDGTEARFWGVNVVASGPFSDKETAEFYVDRLARMGVNIVRFHHMDAGWATPNIFGNNPQTTRKLNDTQLDKFEYFWSLLKKRGIYIYIDLAVNRWPMPGDGVEASEDIDAGFKIEGNFAPHLIELQKEYIKQLLTHKNPYTGTTLAEDPAVVMMEIINEDSLFYIQKSEGFAINTDYYKKIWQELYNKWLTKKFKDKDSLQKRWEPKEKGKKGLEKNEDPGKNTVEIPADYKRVYGKQRVKDTYKFIYDTQLKFYKDMIKYLKSLGVKCALTGSNHWVDDPADLHVNAQFDFVDRHDYWAHPRNGWGYEIGVGADPSPMVKASRGGLIGNIARRRVFGKPYAISEWNCSAPNPYRVEGGLIMSVYAAMHGWHPMQFDFTSTHQAGEKLGHVLDIYNQPAVLALWPATSMIYHRKDVKEAETGYFSRLTRKQVLDPSYDAERYPKIGLIAKTGLMFTDIEDDSSYNDKNLLDKIKTAFYKSVTEEVTWNTKQGIFIIDTERSQGLVGFPEEKSLSFKDAVIKIKTDFAAVVLSSVSKESIKNSKKLLLTAVSRARPKGMELNGKGDIINAGTMPVLVQPVEGLVVLKTDSPIAVYKLSSSGERQGEVEVKKSSKPKGYRFSLSAENKCMHYEIVKK